MKKWTYVLLATPTRCSLVILGVCITMEEGSAAQAELSCEDPHKAHWHLICWFRACCWEHDVSAWELDGLSTCLRTVYGRGSQAFWINPNLQIFDISCPFTFTKLKLRDTWMLLLGRVPLNIHSSRGLGASVYGYSELYSCLSEDFGYISADNLSELGSSCKTRRKECGGT